jgi:hypothetical protein
MIHVRAKHEPNVRLWPGTRSRKWGSFVIGRKTIKKRMRVRLLAIKIELRRTMHAPITKTGALRWLQRGAPARPEICFDFQ